MSQSHIKSLSGPRPLVRDPRDGLTPVGLPCPHYAVLLHIGHNLCRNWWTGRFRRSFSPRSGWLGAPGRCRLRTSRRGCFLFVEGDRRKYLHMMSKFELLSGSSRYFSASFENLLAFSLLVLLCRLSSQNIPQNAYVDISSLSVKKGKIHWYT